MPNIDAKIQTEDRSETITMDVQVWCAECGKGICRDTSDKGSMVTNTIHIETVCTHCRDTAEQNISALEKDKEILEEEVKHLTAKVDELTEEIKEANATFEKMTESDYPVKRG